MKEPVRTGDRCNARVNTSPKVLQAQMNEARAKTSVKSVVGRRNLGLLLLLLKAAFVLADGFFFSVFQFILTIFQVFLHKH